MSLTVRNLEPADEARWRSLWRGYCAFYEKVMPENVNDETWRRLLDDGQKTMFGLVVCEDDGAAVGIVNCILHPVTWGTAPVCYLEDLFVEPAARKLGAGRALIEAVCERARANSWHRVYWRTKCDNATARSLYDKVADLTDWVIYEVPSAASA